MTRDDKRPRQPRHPGQDQAEGDRVLQDGLEAGQGVVPGLEAEGEEVGGVLGDADEDPAGEQDGDHDHHACRHQRGHGPGGRWGGWARWETDRVRGGGHDGSPFRAVF